MYRKDERTLELYKYVGAEMRLFKHLGACLTAEMYGVLSAADSAKMSRALARINEVCSNAEENMFQDFPDLSDDYINVFYGNVGDAPTNPVDAEQITLAKEIVNDIFGENKDVKQSDKED